MITQFKEILDPYLKSKKITKRKLADRLGITTNCLYTYRYGFRPVPPYILLACERLTEGELNFNLESL